MLVVSTREFRDKQKIYLDQIDCGAELLITRDRSNQYAWKNKYTVHYPSFSRGLHTTA